MHCYLLYDRKWTTEILQYGYLDSWDQSTDVRPPCSAETKYSITPNASYQACQTQLPSTAVKGWWCGLVLQLFVTIRETKPKSWPKICYKQSCKLTTEWLKNGRVLLWPSQSSDLNLSKMKWFHLQKAAALWKERAQVLALANWV